MDSKSWIQLLNINGLVSRDMNFNIISDSLQIFFLSLDFTVATDIITGISEDHFNVTII
jgi:hypothetical protein